MRRSMLEKEFTREELRRDRRVCQAPDAVERRCDEILEALFSGKTTIPRKERKR